MEDTMRDLLSKLDAILSETALKDKSDLEAKRRALDDLEADPVASKDPGISAAIDQRKTDLEKEAKSKGIEESVPVKEGSAHGYNVVKWYEKWNDQLKLTKWLRKEAGLPKDAPVYFDDADLVWEDETIVRDALVDPKLKFNDLLDAVIKASGSKAPAYVHQQGVYRRPGVPPMQEFPGTYKGESVEQRESSKYSPTDDVVGFTVNSEKAYNVVMRQFGDYIDFDEDEGVMYVPEKMWPKVETAAFDADGEGAKKVDDDRNWEDEDLEGYANRSADADAEEYHREGSVEESSSMRLIKTYAKGNKSSKVYKDREWGEFLVKFYVNGNHQPREDYHTDDLNDATDTAKKAIGLRKDDEEDSSGSDRGDQYLTREGFEIGDAFGISFSEDFEIGAEIVDILEDGVVIELDETAINYLSENGFTFDEGEIFEGEQHGNSKIYDKCWKGYKKVPGKKRGEPGSCEKIGESGLQYYTGKKKYGKDGMAALAKAGRDGANEEELGRIKDKYKKEDYEIDEAEYQGRKVPLGKPMAGDVKKSKVYVKNPQGNVVKVNFGDKKMRIKKSNPARKKSFRARHNCSNPGPRHKARYWSCRAW